jgi:hypothetical protein
MSNGEKLLASGVGRVSGMCVAVRLLGRAFAAAAFARVAYKFVVCGGRLSGVLNGSPEVCMVVSRGVMSLGSFPSSEVAGRSRVALRVSREARREVLGPGVSLFESLAMITPVGLIWSV